MIKHSLAFWVGQDYFIDALGDTYPVDVLMDRLYYWLQVECYLMQPGDKLSIVILNDEAETKVRG